MKMIYQAPLSQVVIQAPVSKCQGGKDHTFRADTRFCACGLAYQGPPYVWPTDSRLNDDDERRIAWARAAGTLPPANPKGDKA